MILLDTVNRKLQFVLASAKTLTDCPYVTSYADVTTTTYAPGSNNGVTNGVTAVDSVAAPAASTQRQIKSLFVQNADLALIVLKVRYNDNGTTRDMYIAQLQPGDTLQYTDGEGFRVYDANGHQRVVGAGIGAGRWLKTSVLTSGTSVTTGRLTNKIFTRLWAGGGAGGGSTSAVGESGGGGGGASGGYAEKVFSVSPNTAYTYAIGAAGAGSSGANGGVGGITTFAVGATTVTANGGLGGIELGSATILAALGGAAPAISTNGDFNGTGQPGDPGLTLTALLAVSGRGGNSVLGLGGNARNTQGAGNDGVANTGGGGGGGVCLNNGGSVAGGAGGSGCIILDEYA